MIQERYEQLSSITGQYIEQSGQKTMGCICTDFSTKVPCGEILHGLNRDSKTVRQLEELGYRVIYPSPLKQEAVEKMDIADKYVYDAKMNTALIIDGKEEALSLELEGIIANHYYSAGTMNLGGLDIKDNSVTRYGSFDTGFPPEVDANYQKLLGDIGFQTRRDDKGNLVIPSDIPYHTVKKSKFKEIYGQAKDKIRDALSKIKNMTKSKDKEKAKENDSQER